MGSNKTLAIIESITILQIQRFECEQVNLYRIQSSVAPVEAAATFITPVL